MLKQLLLAHRASAPDLDWARSLPFLVLAFNTVANQCTKLAPSFAINLREVRLPADVLHSSPSTDTTADHLPTWVAEMLSAARISYNSLAQTLHLNSLANKKKFDLRRDVSISYKLGEKVLVVKGLLIDNNLPKGEIPTTGPYTVCEVLPHDNYLLSGPGSRQFRTPIHVERLLPYYEERTAESSARTPVECIVAHRHRTLPGSPGPVREYCVRWLGFGKNYDRWLEPEYLTDIPHLLEVYHRVHGLEDLVPPFATNPVRPTNLPPPSAEALNRRHFRKRVRFAEAVTLAPAASAAPGSNDPPLDDGGTPPCELDAPVVTPPSATAQQPILLTPASSSPPSLLPVTSVDDKELDLPIAANFSKNRWTYGLRMVTSRGPIIRWYPEKHFSPLELESPHFEALRAATTSPPTE